MGLGPSPSFLFYLVPYYLPLVLYYFIASRIRLVPYYFISLSDQYPLVLSRYVTYQISTVLFYLVTYPLSLASPSFISSRIISVWLRLLLSYLIFVSGPSGFAFFYLIYFVGSGRFQTLLIRLFHWGRESRPGLARPPEGGEVTLWPLCA